MTSNRRNLILVAVLVALVAVGAAVAVGIALGRDDDHKPKFPGRVAVRDGCGLVHFWQDGSDKRTLCLPDVWDAVSLSWNGKKLAWDTRTSGIRTADAEGQNEFNVPVPQGANYVPSLSPDGEEVAFLHSPRDDGRYDIWLGSVAVSNSEQVTNTQNVSDIAWSPKGDWLAYVQNWSEETLEGQISLARPDGQGAKTLVKGDAPEWAPDGKHLAYVHNRSIWIVGVDGKDPKRIVPNGHAPAWSRDGEQIAFMRADRCGKPVCKEHVFVAFTDGTRVRQIGPAFADERTVLWLRDPFE